MRLTLPRRVQPELLDGLDAEDPRAQRSRDDLQCLHWAMATLTIVQTALDHGTAEFSPRTLLELGAGDGSLMLRLAQGRAGRWPHVRVTLLDRLALVAPQTIDGLRRVGWVPRAVAMDVFDWMASADDTRWDVVFANLFMHHFPPGNLERLLEKIAVRSRVFLCCEPRRAALPLVASHLIGLLGAGPVTRHDAVFSVHAGFRAHELSDLWPDRQQWILTEYRARLFSHCFLAIRKEP